VWHSGQLGLPTETRLGLPTETRLGLPTETRLGLPTGSRWPLPPAGGRGPCSGRVGLCRARETDSYEVHDNEDDGHPGSQPAVGLHSGYLAEEPVGHVEDERPEEGVTEGGNHEQSRPSHPHAG